MPFLHKYQEHDFQNGFQTHNSILDTVPYKPEVIFIGTHNHGWSWNNSDFFYGRGMFMWTVLANLFLHNQNHLVSARTVNNNEPTFDQIFEICKKGKMIFADIVKGISENVFALEQPLEQNVIVDNQYTWKSYKDKPLDEMAVHGWIDSNVSAIINYINTTPTIKHIYFTFKSGKWLVDKMHEICNGLRPGVSFESILTPTANGLGQRLQQPFNERAWGLAHCWVWNGLEHNCPINKPNYGHLDHNWLLNRGVDPNNF